MKKMLLLFLILPIISFSQCPPTEGVFTSQAEIDALAIDYPDCTEVGSFVISGDDITDLSGLNQIDSCTSFSISGNLVLQNTNGLNSNIIIRFVEGTGTSFSINNNASLLTIDGLENFVSQSGFESSFSISDNPMLTSLEGVPSSFQPLTYFYITNNDFLINLNGLGDYSYGAGEYTEISDNDSLIDLTGLDEVYSEIVRISNNDNLQSLNGPELSGFEDYLYIENNQNLTDLSDFYAGNFLSIGLVIRNNPNLSICSTIPVCYFIDSNIEEGIMSAGIFENNAPGCNSNFEVKYACGVNSNDNCGYTTNILAIGETITANNEFATTSAQTPSCNDIVNRKDIWFALDSGDSTTIDIFLQAGFYMQLWNANSTFAECGNLIQVENACGSETLFDIPVTSNNFYFIQVWNDDALERGGSSWFDLTVQDGTLSNQDFQFEEVKIFPNPVNDILNIQSNMLIDKIEVFNLLGQSVKTLSIGSSTNIVDVSTLGKGIYLMQISINGKTSTYKVLKK